MKNIFNIRAIRNAIYTLFCVCFFSCKDWKEHSIKHNSRIDSIQVITVQKDTVWIFSHSTGHISINPKNYREK